MLSLEHGLDAVTTEMISHEAGISLRTFFNYFHNKTAAIFGEPPKFEGAHVDAFLRSGGPLPDDLRTLLSDHLQHIMIEPEVMKSFAMLMRAEPKLREVHDTILEGLRDDLTAVIAARLPAEKARVAVFLAEALIGFCKIVVDEWANRPAEPLQRWFAQSWPSFTAACGALSAD
ncbi:TetR/AcrR family transcriptional regulator [Acidimangrovimonas sediminis]|uniref:TetR/AcrR family transcriptional regulator n=1 Tax=Acidimangrovimonas sediminis TaxID=2056283 RepID=UPI0018ECDE6E|nr:TetR/AcrR family transcriptional regulator [Acidimangrovimonas sediminis]